MRALIMAAGLGTRLRPLTDATPKPLVKVLGRPMVEYLLESLAEHGYREAIMNVHYLPDQLREFAREWNKKGRLPRLEIQDESKEILGSGGAVSTAGTWLFEKDETALVCNADTIADTDLGDFYRAHQKSGAECTLALTPNPETGRKYNGARLVGGLITGFEKPGYPDPGLLHFFGFYLINRSCLKRLAAPGRVDDIMKQVWLPLVKEKGLGGWVYNDFYLDLGTPADLQAAEAFLKSRNR